MNIYQDYETHKLESLRNHRKILEKVKSIVKSLDPEARLIFFGSVLRGNFDASSDIDLIIIPSSISLKDKIKVTVLMQVDAPLEIHVITKEIFENWYLRFLDVFEDL
ncbi:MAG TPA: nucleotidyltransferase domain-containing protein [Thermoplasmataceae archaeon]|nr:nucleotidyltransferase domain-containing protein [Thermoplasmatales archaeon AK]HLH85494.1 nucleotidyltransferase domain-containing protein [Thermoplasmataceae archaeon]